MPIETIIIEFQANTDALTQGEAKIADSMKKVNTELSKQQQELGREQATLSKLTNSLDKLTGESKQAVQQLLKLSGKEVVAGFDKLGISVDDYVASLKQTGTETGKTAEKTKTAAQQLKKLREELISLAAQGKENTKQFKDLQNEAGELSDSIGDAQARIKAAGSDTAVFDGLLSATQGLVGGFAAVQGAAAIFGDESEELQETLLKVNSAMAVLQGLQQIQQVLQKESAASLLLLNTQRKIEVIQINLAAAAESKNIVIRGAAAVAQRVLNTVMAANPIGIVITALAALAAALVYFTSNAREAAIEQGKLNAALASASELLDAEVEGYENANRKIVSDLEARGEKESKILEQGLNTRKNVLTATEREITQLRRTIDQSTEADTKEARDRLTELERTAQKQRVDIYVEENKLKGTLTKEQEAAEKEAADRKKKAQEDALAAQRNGLEQQIAGLKIAQLELDKETFAYRNLEMQVLRLTARLEALGQAGNKALLPIAEAEKEIGELTKARIAEVTKSETDFTATMKVEGQKRIDGTVKVYNKMKDIKVSDLADDSEINRQRLDFALQTAGQITAIFAEAFKQQTDRQLQAVQDQKNRIKELEEAGQISAKESERRMILLDEKERNIKTAAAKRDKAIAIFQATMDTAQAVVKAYATTGPIAGAVLAAIVGAIGAAQIALIASRPIPKFAKGKKGSYEGFGIVGEAGSELIERNGRMEVASKPTLTWLNKNDKVFTTAETARMVENMPSMSAPPRASISTTKKEKIDYDKIGKSIAKHLPENNISFDKDGFNIAVKKGQETIKYLDKRRRFGA